MESPRILRRPRGLSRILDPARNPIDSSKGDDPSFGGQGISSGAKVCTVSSAGEVTAVKKGSAKIIAAAGKKSATVNVTVK